MKSVENSFENEADFADFGILDLNQSLSKGVLLYRARKNSIVTPRRLPIKY